MKNLIITIAALCLTLISFSQDVLSNDTPEDVYTIVEKMPSFPGDVPALFKYLKDNIQYPTEALKSGIGGKVLVEFIVDATGKVKSPVIKKSLGALLDEEAIRVVSQMPLWEPGSQQGKNVAVKYVLPIVFSAN